MLLYGYMTDMFLNGFYRTLLETGAKKMHKGVNRRLHSGHLHGHIKFVCIHSNTKTLIAFLWFFILAFFPVIMFSFTNIRVYFFFIRDLLFLSRPKIEVNAEHREIMHLIEFKNQMSLCTFMWGEKSFSLSFPYIILAFKGGKSMVVINIDNLKSMILYNEMSSTKLTFRQQIKRTMVFMSQ